MPINQSINLFVTIKHTQVQNNYDKKLLYGVTGSTQVADAPFVQATHVLKTSSIHIIVQNTKPPIRTHQKRKKENK